MISRGMQRAKEIIEQNRDLLERIVQMLMKKGIVGKEEIDKLFS